MMVGRVRAVFNDQARGEKPVVRHDDGLFGPASVVWRVHGDVTTMMGGGVAALLLQMLHPAVLAGVWDHSNFRHDMLCRLRRTARFIALTSYGSRDEAGVSQRTREIARLVLDQRAGHMAVASVQALTFGAAVDLLPDWARRMHGFSGSRLTRPLVRAGTSGIARTLRWAFS